VFSKKTTIAIAVLSFLGLLDSSYLAAKHYSGEIPPCAILQGCDIVTTSQYAEVGGVSVALLGVIYYLIVFISSIALLDSRKDSLAKLLSRFVIIGFLASLWLIFLQVFIIKAFCLYCLFSAFTSVSIFVIGMFFLLKKPLASA